MSHYTLAVITKGKPINEELEKILAPFSEELEVEAFRTREEIIAQGRKEIEEYKNTTYKKYLDDPEEYIKSTTNEDHIDYIMNKFPEKLNWTDEEVYQDVVEYEDKHMIMSDGSLKTLHNPRGKWDWWVVGGRWNNFIITKDKQETNSARIKDIVLTNDGKYKRNLRFWELVVENQEPQNEDEQKMVNNFFRPEYYIETFKTKEDFARLNSKFTTYAVLDKEGVWHEAGEMGWFGISNAKPEDKFSFMENYEKFVFENADEDDWLTLIDCHI